MALDSYYDVRNLVLGPGPRVGCPVMDCTADIGIVESQWGELPYCPEHRLRLHNSSCTFVYHHGPDRESKREAALRNILFEREYFGEHILGNAAKAESHRIAHETSEDAVTWNVFSRLAAAVTLNSREDR